MFHCPVQYNGRHFSKTIEYSAIDFTKMASIVPAFEARIRDWYITPGEMLTAGKDGWHNAFSLCALSCLLIDTLSQFDSGSTSSGRSKFIKFAKDNFQVFKSTITPVIRTPSGKNITTIGEALYFGFRNGILHEAHIPPYAQILPEPKIARIEATGKTIYANGRACPSVILDPQRLFAALKVVFEQYIKKLGDQRNQQLRANFQTKFAASFGIDITAAT